MNADKVRQALETYRLKLEKMGIAKCDYPHDDLLDSPTHGLEHAHAMIEKIERFLVEGRTDKVNRWLGFLQGVVWMGRCYPLKELKDHNRTDHESPPK